MDYKQGVGVGALAGVALDGTQRVRAYAKYGQMISDQIDMDCYTLGQNGTLPPLEPPPPPLNRRPRNLLLIAVLAALATGALFGLVTFLTVIISTAVGDGPMALGLVGGVFLGMFVAVVTTAMPGAVVALVVQRHEAGLQHAATAHTILMEFHKHRETVRREVDAGHISPEEAARRLAALQQD